MRVPRSLGWISLALVTAFWLVGVAVPLATIAMRALGVDQVASVASPGGSEIPVALRFFDPDIVQAAEVTFRQAGWSALWSGLIGLPVGLLVARRSGRVARAVDALLLLPQGVPTVVAAAAWVALLGRNSWLAREANLDFGYSFIAVVIAHVFFNAPWVALVVAQSRRAVDEARIDAAASLGAGRLARWRHLLWPELKWAWGAAVAQAFAACAMSFALVLHLGGGPHVETLEVALYSRLRGGALDLSGAALCAVWEMLIVGLPWAAVLWLRSRAPGGAIRLRKAGVRSRGRVSRVSRNLGDALTLFIALGFLAPYLAVVGGSLRAWRSAELWSEISGPLAVSLEIAVLAGAGAVVFALLTLLAIASLPARARAAAALLATLPGGISVLVLGLGIWLAYGGISGVIDPFDGSWLAIVGLQILVFSPALIRLLWPLAQGAQRTALEAAWTLGASPARAWWWIEWPRWRGGVFSAWALATGWAIGEVAALSLFYSERLVALPLLVSRWMGQYRFEDARALSVLLLVLSGSLMAAVSLRGRGWDVHHQ